MTLEGDTEAEALPHERWCRYCRISWSVRRDPATDEVLDQTDTHCPDCYSDDAMPLAEAQRQRRPR